MLKWKCSVCGFIYDEALGLPDQGIPAGTAWSMLPDSFVCPWCGAAADLFLAEVATTPKQTPAAPDTAEVAEISATAASDSPATVESFELLDPGLLSVIFSNLQKGCEKQRRFEEQALFGELSAFHDRQAAARSAAPATASAGRATLARLSALLKEDLDAWIPQANAIAAEHHDRGAKRALVWDEKVSRMSLSLVDRIARSGESMLIEPKMFVCDICGFLYIGNTPPEVCPVCKVPSFKMSPVARR